jgi:hypothetical protein
MHNTAPTPAERFHFDNRLNFRVSKTVKSRPPASAAAVKAHTMDSMILSDKASPINNTEDRARPIASRYARNGQL